MREEDNNLLWWLDSGCAVLVLLYVCGWYKDHFMPREQREADVTRPYA